MSLRSGLVGSNPTCFAFIAFAAEFPLVLSPACVRPVRFGLKIGINDDTEKAPRSHVAVISGL